MSTIKDGGPAFPVAEYDHQTFASKTVDETRRLLSGMSLRDYFAIHASVHDIREQGEVIRSEQVRNGDIGILPDGWRITARYMHADAMLAAREKGGA